MSEAADSRSPSVARKSTRGVAMIGSAKIFFMLSGFVQQVVLTHILGKDDYGVFSSVLNAVSILNNVVVTGSIQGMSRAVTESGTTALRRGLRLHVLLGVVLASGFAVLAHPIGVGILGDPQLPRLLRIAAIVVGDYTVYAALVGALNGQQRFTAQAGLDMTFATLRTALMVGLALTAWRVAGAVAGFAVASVAITIVALLSVWPRGAATPTEEPYGAFVRRYLGFFAPVLLYHLALNMVLQADLLVVKALLVRRPGLTLDTVNGLVGVYRADQQFAFLPYQLLLAVTFVVFPIVSKTTLEGDRDAARRFVSGSLRFSAIALGAMVAVLVGLSAGVLRLAYPPDFQVGATALRILSLGQSAFALAVISTTIILAAGRTAAATLLMSAMLAAVFVGDVLGITLAHTPLGALAGAATGTAVGCALGLVAIAVYMRRTFGAFAPPGSLARVVAAAAVTALALRFAPVHGKLWTLILAVVGVGLYAVVIVAIGEVRRDERNAIRQAVLRRLGRG